MNKNFKKYIEREIKGITDLDKFNKLQEEIGKILFEHTFCIISGIYKTRKCISGLIAPPLKKKNKIVEFRRNEEVKHDIYSKRQKENKIQIIK